MQDIKKVAYTLDNIHQAVELVKKHMDSCEVITFTGPLGAGKTTLVRELLESYGITEPVTSPTYTYVNVYTMPNGKTVYHFDLYRIESLDDFIAAGFDEYLYAPNSICLIEWPAAIEPLLTKNVCHVTLDYHELEQQVLNLVKKT